MDRETFLIRVYVMVDDFAKSRLPEEKKRPGIKDSLSRSEVMALALLSQLGRFVSQREFYRQAKDHLHSAFPNLPNRSQFNRLMRKHRGAITAFALYVAQLLEADSSPYQVVDGMGLRVRNAKRRGGGWLDGRADIGWSNRLGWYEGFYVLLCNTATGAINGFGYGPASTNDRRMAETFLAVRQQPDPRLPSVGEKALCPYLADKGFGGRRWQKRWEESYQAEVICPPTRADSVRWPKALRRWHAGLRQIAETVHGKLIEVFRLDRDRPHALDGFESRLAAAVGLHNLFMWLNQQFGRPLLAFIDLVDWDTI